MTYLHLSTKLPIMLSLLFKNERSHSSPLILNLIFDWCKTKIQIISINSNVMYLYSLWLLSSLYDDLLTADVYPQCPVVHTV